MAVYGLMLEHEAPNSRCVVLLLNGVHPDSRVLAIAPMLFFRKIARFLLDLEKTEAKVTFYGNNTTFL